MSLLGWHDVLQFKRVKFTEKVSVHLNFFPLGPWVSMLLLLLLSRLQSCQTLCDPKMAAHQASLSLGFSRQEHWSGLPFPSPMHESEKGK